MMIKTDNIIGLPKLLAIGAAVLVFAGSLSAQTPPAGSPVALHGQLSVNNGQIVDKNGDPFQMKGMSFFWSTSDWPGAKFYTSGVVNWLADDWKVDVLRVAMNPSNRGAWETVVSAAISKGLYVIIDWHSHNATNQQSDAVTFFTSQSNTYKNTPNVIYELYNEPCPKSEQGGACLGEDWAAIKKYAQAVTNAIRNNDKNNLIVIGSPDYSKRVDQASGDPVTGGNIVYSVHYYTAEPGTQHQSTLRGWCNQALNKGAALLVTEFGLSEADGGQKNTQKIDTDEANVWFDYLDKNQIGWVNWSIVDKNEAASALSGGAGTSGNWSDGNLSASGRFIRNKLRLYASSSYTLTTSKQGEGQVAKSPDKTSYTLGVPVTVTATPASGWTFAGFEGGETPPQNAANPAVISMNANKSVKAVFAENNIINKNSTFTVDISSWSSSSNSNLTLSQDNYQLKATMVSAGTTVDGVRVTQSGIKIDAGHKYALSFSARGQSARTITPRLVNNTGTKEFFKKTVNLTTAMQTFTVETETPVDVSITNAILRFDCGNESPAWYIDDVKLVDKGTSSVVSHAVAAPRAVWSISNLGGSLQLRGPIETGSSVSLYDTRGKAVKSMAAKDGLALNTLGVPAGSYFVVVKNRAGADVYRSRVSFVR
jgi:endoglucanase